MGVFSSSEDRSARYSEGCMANVMLSKPGLHLYAVAVLYHVPVMTPQRPTTCGYYIVRPSHVGDGVASGRLPGHAPERLRHLSVRRTQDCRIIRLLSRNAGADGNFTFQLIRDFGL